MRSKLVPEMQSRWEVDVKDVQLELRTDHTGHGISLRIAKLAVNRDRLGGSTEVNLEGVTAELVSITGGTWGFGAAPLLQHLGLSATLDSGAGREGAAREDHEDSARLNIVLSEASGVQPSLAASPGAVQVIKDLVDAYLQGAAAGASALRASALERLPTVPRVTPEAYQELLKLERLPTREEQAQRHFIEAVASVAWLADCQVRAKALATRSEDEVISLDAFLEEPDDASKPQCFSLSLKVPSVAASCTSVKRPDQPGLSLILKGASLDLRGTLPATSVEADGLPQDIVVDAQLEHLALRVTTVHSAEDLVVLSGDVDRSLAAVVVSACVRRGEVTAVGSWSTSLRVKQAPLRFLLAPLRLQHTLSAVQDVAAVLEVGAGGPEREGQTEDAFQPELKASKAQEKVNSSGSVSVMSLELDLDVAAPVLHWEEHLEEAFILRFGRVRVRTVENSLEPGAL